MLSNRELESIHMASLEVLEDTEMRCEPETILKAFKETGTDINEKERNVKIPQHLVKEALRKAPPRSYSAAGVGKTTSC